MRQVTIFVMSLMMAGCLCGCVLIGEDKADVGIEFTSGIRFYQGAPDTPEGGSRLEVNFLPWVQDEIKARREAEMIMKAATAVESDG